MIYDIIPDLKIPRQQCEIICTMLLTKQEYYDILNLANRKARIMKTHNNATTEQKKTMRVILTYLTLVIEDYSRKTTELSETLIKRLNEIKSLM